MIKPEKKLFLLDALALIYRAHFAFSKAPRITSRGLNTSCVFGFTNALLEILQKEKPTHIGVAFDSSKKTFRHETFVEYKANRQAMPEDIAIAIPYVKKLVEAMNIPILILDGYEADDIIGTMAKRAAKAGFEVFMMTPDKDYGQLVEEHIYVYRPAFMGKPAEKLGVKEVLDRWQIQDISQVTDMLGLMGDSVDNIPGIPGVGEKTAQKLIAEFGTVENLIASADKLKGKLKENVVQFAQQGMLSKQLATIHLDVPLDFDEEALIHSEPDKPRLSALLDELEFRQLRKRLLGEDDAETNPFPAAKPAAKGQMGLFDETVLAPAAPPSTKKPGVSDMVTAFEKGARPAVLPNTDDMQSDWTETETVEKELEPRRTIYSVVHDYRLVDTPALRKSLVHYLSQQQTLCFDSETTSTDPVEADLVGLSFAYRKGEAFYVPVPPDREGAQAIVEEFRSVFENPEITKIGQNLKYDMLMLKKYGIEVQGKLFDTMVAHYLIEPEQRHNMDIMAMTHLNYEPVSIETLIGKKGPKQLTMRDVEIQKVVEYAGEDADITLQLKDTFLPLLEKNQLTKLFYEVEMPLVRVLGDMELGGVKVDMNALAELSATLETDIRQVQSEIYELAGGPFNVGSPKQLGEVLFEKLKLDSKAKKTKTGQYATGEEILTDLEADHEIARKILDYRELVKLKNTYVDALPLMMSKQDGRIHTSFNQAVAATGRLSSTNPNLQNIPIRTPRGREIRKAFVPHSDDFLIMSADYSQIELRIMAAFSGDQTMLDAFNNGIDIHTQTASKVFKVPLTEVDSDMRRKAKMVNFGIIYGISAFGLSRRLRIPRREAAEIIQEYFAGFPAIKEYMDGAINKARECEYAETILGRRRYLRDINSRNMTDRSFAERNAINAPIQGSAADMIKIAMINIDEFIRKNRLKSRMILTVHDELVFDAHKDELDLLKENVAELMRNAIPLPVKMETGIGIGENWLVAH
ncbi:DNA polymerase I [Larkinella terrae]|uniref:DNA polymerase I n=1 Tax=Larkinella terrae TaxID=2025311 RepID=A0A7K0ETH6_9BACT|nr:DNA polymerase I [Larkinella terrae]MRS65069.1 DNA polymerase I [Larkinella terrae]